MNNFNTLTIVELVSFQTKEEAEQEKVLTAIFNTNAVLDNIKGFIKRHITQQEDGTWVEIVFWQSRKLAEDGLKEFLAHPISQPLLAIIKEGSVKIEYSTLIPSS